MKRIVSLITAIIVIAISAFVVILAVVVMVIVLSFVKNKTTKKIKRKAVNENFCLRLAVFILFIFNKNSFFKTSYFT